MLPPELTHVATTLFHESNQDNYNPDVQTMCTSVAFLALVECGGALDRPFDWNNPVYQRRARSLAHTYSDRPCYPRWRGGRTWVHERYLVDHNTLHMDQIGVPDPSTDIEYRDIVALLRQRLSLEDFALLDAVYLRGISLKELAGTQVNSLSKRCRRILRTARKLLRELA